MVKQVLGIVVNDLAFFNKHHDVEGLVAMLNNWQEFCASPQVHIQYDDQTQLGVYATANIEAQATIRLGALRKVYIGARSHAPVPRGHKWSSVKDYAICGPFSMLNHACRDHANVDTDFNTSDLWAIRSIAPSEQLLVEYASEDYLRVLGMGIECLQCIDGDFHILHCI